MNQMHLEELKNGRQEALDRERIMIKYAEIGNKFDELLDKIKQRQERKKKEDAEDE
jgi:lysyl-tRNA synthetase class II